jgi:hypothetical protein
VPLDQRRRDRRAGIVELGGAVRRFAEQYETLMPEALGKIRKLVDIGERLCGFRDEMAELAADRSRALRRHE